MNEVKFIRKFVAKTYELVNKFVPEIKNNSTGAYLYGADDLLPNNNLKLINDCGVAMRCVRKKARYIQSDGFAQKASADFQVNETQKANDLLASISSYAAYYEGFALLIRRTADLTIAEVKSIPFQCVRKREDGSLVYNPTKGTAHYKQDKDTIHPAFNPNIKPDKFAEQLLDFKNQSEILYVYEQTADNPHYPVPDYNAGIEDIQTCIEISKMDLEITLNGFMPSGILTTHEINNTDKDDQQKTPYDYFSDELDNFTGKKKTDGKSGRFKLMHVMVSNLAEAPKLEKYDAKTILEASDAKRETIAREVCRLFGVHPILVGFSDAAVLGNTQALANVITEFNNYVNPIQRMIANAFKTLYPTGDWTISQFNPITYIPAEVWAELTSDEKRAMIGYAPKPKEIEPAVPVTTTPN